MKKVFMLLVVAMMLVGCGREAGQAGAPGHIGPDAEAGAMHEHEAGAEYEGHYELYYNVYFNAAPVVRRPMVALTFDDGPSAYTDSILDLLERYGGRATFFVTGRRISDRSDTVLRAFELGNEIANHTWSHPRLTSISDAEIIREIQYTSSAIAALTGVSHPMHRPPFGSSDERVARVSGSLGYSIVKWTVDPKDWRDRNPDIVYERIMSRAVDGAIILAHDIHPTTAQAMERVIPRLVEEGFALVTVTELLHYMHGGLEPGRTYGTNIILD